jgi:hypothetical protein
MTPTTLFDSLMELPEKERFEIAMAVLDRTSPSAMTDDDLIQEAVRRQDELESGAVRAMGFDELVAGLHYRPKSPEK